MKKPIKLFLALIFIVAISCDKEEMTPDTNFDDTGIMTVLGEKLDNPYTIENMQIAYSNLKSSGAISEDIEISATHKYIRFLPKSEADMELLRDDTTLTLFDIPMDYEILEGGVCYHDPSLPDSSFTWQYCAVEIDKQLPNVYYELIEELYIPLEEIDDEELKSTSRLNEVYDILDDEALRITGNLDDDYYLKSTNEVQRRKRWRPSGRIRHSDNTTNPSQWMPVRGVEVVAKSWFSIVKGSTDANGNFSCNGKLKGHVNYSLKWERYNFSIRNGTIGQAKLDGPRYKEKAWNKDILSGHARYHAVIFRAANHYYYDNINGLRRPPENSAGKPQMKIAAMYKDNDDKNAHYAYAARVLGVFNTIKIWNPDRNSDRIYSTMIHELAHASHWNMDSEGLRKGDEIVVESWARGVQWNLTRMVYPNHRGGGTIRPNYTQVVVDMVDAPGDINFGASGTNDQVTGYTMRQIEDALKGQKTWNGWRDNIINKYANGTENNLGALFSFWN
jgi:hypothetical protein